MKKCPACATEFEPNYPGRVCCSQACAEKRKGSFEERFWKRVKKTRKCWEWQGTLGANGYARIRRHMSRERVLVHRASWEMAHGDIPEGKLVLHKCDNRRCVRPAHLFLGTQRDNMQDMLKKGRANKAVGAAHGMSRLTETQARDILKRHAAGERAVKLAAEYDVGEVHVQRIVSGERWGHLQG